MNEPTRQPATHDDIAGLRVEIRELKNELTKFTNALFDPENPEKGFVVRVDRLEQSAAFQRKLGWTVASAAAGSIAASLWALLRNSHP